jgi:hypothetical protein
MEGRPYRYCVGRISQGWAVLDRRMSHTLTAQNVIEVFPGREAARQKARELNLAEHSTPTTQDAAE